MQSEKNLSLWQLTNEQQNLLNQLVNKETGEVDELIQERLNQLEPNIENKCLSVSKWIRKLESEKGQLDSLLSEVANRKAAYATEVERYMKYLQYNMEKSGIKEISCPFFTVKLKKNPYSTDITDQAAIPEEYIRVKIKKEISVNKNLIKEEVLRTGSQVPGAYVSQKNKLEITTSKL